MSNQSMKYHELPSFETLVAYQRGDLSVVDSQWIEQLIQNNPMVKAVAESTSSINVAAVKSLSNKTSQVISSTYYTKTGFFSKYGVWIGLSTITLIIVATYFFQMFQNDGVYEKSALNLNIETPENNTPSNQNVFAFSAEELSDKEGFDELEKAVLDVKKNKDLGIELVANEYQNETLKKKNKVAPESVRISKENKTTSTDEIYSSEDSHMRPKQEDKIDEFDNTRTFVSENKSVNKSVVLSVQQVQILAKTNPDDFTSSSKKDKKGNPMQSFGKNPGNNSSYAINDVPKYPGGDNALQNYFIGKLRPIKIKEIENHYDKSVMIDLEVNSRGKLKDYTIHGQLHPEHQKALIKAIEEISRFEKGTESITYSIGIAF
ncbi:MAG TPA: hypothetical protein VKY37_11890 [Brumimicrobium sp.]|nr:hypothetical protein [Brumimicrobium sp.]